MGIVNIEKWKCKSCKFEFAGNNGLYEAVPSDFGTTHHIAPYYCPKCNFVKNVVNCVSPDKPRPWNEKWIVHDSRTCEHCGTEMQFLDKKIKYNCPKCGKKEFEFIKNESEIWT